MQIKLEKRQLHYFLRLGPRVGVILQQLLDGLSGPLADLTPLYLLLHYVVLNHFLQLPDIELHLLFFGRVEGRSPVQHFIHKHPQSSHVQFLVMPVTFYHFWSEVVGSPTESVPIVSLPVGPAKICNFEIAGDNKDVLWLDISVQDLGVAGMQIDHCPDDVSHQMCCLLLAEFLVFFYQVEQRFLAELHEHEDVLAVLENVVKSDDVGMPALRENPDFVEKLFSQILIPYFFVF